MHRHTFLLTGILLAAALCAGCSVKEDRTPCPCWLDIDVSLCERQGETVSLKGWNTRMPVFGERLHVADWPDCWETPVPKGIIHYTAYTGFDRCVLSGQDMIIPEGEQCDELWAYHASVICDGEEARDRVVPHKQYATVTMKLNQVPSGNLEALVTSRSAGMSLEDLSPAEGVFRFITPQNPEGLFVFRLPRQADSTLELELLRDGRHYETFALGELIERTGYDWAAQDLDDIYIGVDFYLSSITISLDGWEEGTKYEFEL